MLVTAVFNMILFYSLWKAPEKMPKKWANATIKCSPSAYRIILVIATIFSIIIAINSMLTLTPALAIFNIAALIFFFAYAITRHNAKKTHIDMENMLDVE